MRKIVIGTAALGLVIGSATIVEAGGASAAAPTTDLVLTASVAGGESVVGTRHLVAFTFELKNNGPDTVTSSADMTYNKLHNGYVVDQLCVQPDRKSFEPDSPGCEPGALAVGQVTNMTLIVKPTAGAPNRKLTVQVCASTEDTEVDPVASNNCKNLSVTLG
jgi:hypothetical protein